MINANELRIGNFIYEKILGNVKILEIHTKVVVVESINLTVNKEKILQQYTLSLNHIEPIIIDDDIIKKWWHNRKNKNDDSILSQTLNSNKIHLVVGNDYYIKCDYLHQLQNAYFVITGKELIVVANGS